MNLPFSIDSFSMHVVASLTRCITLATQSGHMFPQPLALQG